MHSICKVLVLLSIVGLALAQWGGPIGNELIYSFQFNDASDLSMWSYSQSADISIVPGYQGRQALNITTPQPAQGQSPVTTTLTTDLNQLLITTRIKSVGVSIPHDVYNGIKIMVHYVGNISNGEENYVNANNWFGTHDWTTDYNYQISLYSDISAASVVIGLQDSYGTLLIDSVNITVRKAHPPPIPAPMVNPPPIYNGHDGIPRLRGMMSPTAYISSDITNLGTWKPNLLRWQMVWQPPSSSYFSDMSAYDSWLNQKLTETDQLLAACQANGIKVVVDLHTPPGGSDSQINSMFLTNALFQEKFLEVWGNISTRYKGNPAVWGYDLANEPNQAYMGDPGTLQWQQIATKAIQVIRRIDPNVTIIVESEYGGGPGGYEWLYPIDDPHVVYSVHMYDPYGFTFQGVPGENVALNSSVYPGIVNGEMYNKDRLKQTLASTRAFQLAYNVQMYVGEFSAVRWAKDGTALNWISDCISIFEEYGWDWSYHAYREYNGWSVEYNEDYYNNNPVNYDTPRKTLLLNYFAQNVNPFPPTTSTITTTTTTTTTTTAKSTTTTTTSAATTGPPPTIPPPPTTAPTKAPTSKPTSTTAATSSGTQIDKPTTSTGSAAETNSHSSAVSISIMPLFSVFVVLAMVLLL